MPSNRRGQPQAEKRAELINAARELFIQDGYDVTPMNRIAKQAGVTPNTIYWYFKDKDELLLAVLDNLLAEQLSHYHTLLNSPLADQLYWLVEQLQRVNQLVATVHTRTALSPAVNQWHEGFHSLLEQLMGAQLSAQLPAEQRKAQISIVTFTIEGLISHQVDPATTRAICETLVASQELIATHAREK